MDVGVDVDVVLDGDVDLNLLPTLDVTSPRGSPGRFRATLRSPHRYEGMLSFQRLDVYQLAIRFLALCGDIVSDLPRGHASRADQLERSAESVVRNIAEGAGRWSARDGAKHYKIARGEAMECAASLDVLKVKRLISVEHYDEGLALLEHVVGMLTKML